MKASYLLYDVGSTYSKVTALATADNSFQLLGGASAPTTVAGIAEGLAAAKNNLPPSALAGLSADHGTLASSSAAGGLRMVAMGYMPRVTAKAAKEVAMNAGARVLEVVSHEEPPDYRLEVLMEIRPDIILLAGGTDSGDGQSMLENARIIVQSKVKAKVIIAGNLVAQPETAKILEEGGVEYVRVGNVMPTIHDLNVRPAREAIHHEFIKQITHAPGLAKLLDMVDDGQVVPTPAAILMGAELLAQGTFSQKGAGGVLVLDIGGATTDVHSVLPELADLRPEEKGLVINNDKQASFRTVEGNLGLRVSASGIVEAVGPAGVFSRLADSPPTEEEAERLIKYAAFLENNTGHLPQNDWERALEPALAGAALEVALKRHAGYWVKEYNPVLGLAPGTPMGRDLRGVKWVIGVGGFFTHQSPESGLEVLRGVFKNPGLSLFPEQPDFRLDSKYLLYAIGLIGRKYPDQALAFAKEYFDME